jgi:TolB-like protein/Tfp pilus assembly protein PilF
MPSEPSADVKFEIGHVLFIDIVSYSKLLITEQSEQLQTLKEIVRGTEQFRLAKAEGKLLGLPTGDGGALVFRTSPEAPVLCAIEITKELQKYSGSKERPQLRLRMGIHSGPVNEISDLNEQANIAGAGINIAQRVMDCGDAGHILLSQHVADDLEQYPRWRSHLHDLGECEVKHGVRVRTVNFYTDEVGNPEVPEKFKSASVAAAVSAAKKPPSRPNYLFITGVVALIVIAIAVGGFPFWQRGKPKTSASTAAIPEKSIAVLPFANLSRDPDNAYFADGIQDEILTRLSKIADLKVISRTSTQLYQSKPGNLSEIARQLSVAHLLEGSVQKSGEAVRVNVQLIKAANDSHLWAETFDRKLTDIFAVESDIAKAIASQLQAKLTGREEQEITSKPTNNPQAYDAYLRGLAIMLNSAATPGNALAAQKYLREAVRLDPKFALGWARLSLWESNNYVSGNLPTTPALKEEARQAADTALDLQPDLGEALLAKGKYHYGCLKDYDTAVRYFEQARRVLPNSSEIPENLAYVARRRGAWEQSEGYFNEAERLDPRNIVVRTQHVQSYVALRHFPEASQKVHQILSIRPDDPDAIALKAGIAQAEGDLPRAAALLAPLHFEASDAVSLEIQIYQSILERRPAQMIIRLKELLATPNPALGYINGELRFYLGWAQQVADDTTAAKATWQQARSELEALLPAQPEDSYLIDDLALVAAFQGDKSAAIAFAERALALVPIEKDAFAGPNQLDILARVCAQVGEPDRAIATLQKLLSLPYPGWSSAPLIPALLRLDPMFDPLRNDPRFQKLCESPETK